MITTLFDEDGLRILQKREGATATFTFQVLEATGGRVLAQRELLEGSARRAGRELRRAIRKLKEARGDTPRGMAEYSKRREAANAHPVR